MITDEREAVLRIVRMIKEKKVRAVDGTDIDIAADSVCVHGDGTHVLVFVKNLCAAFAATGIETAPLADIVL